MSALEEAIALVRKNGYTVIPPDAEVVLDQSTVTAIGRIALRRLTEPAVDPLDDPRYPATGRITIEWPADEEDPNQIRSID